MVTKDPGTHFFFFLTETHWFWTGTHDFSQDESQDSPQLFVTESLLCTYILLHHFQTKLGYPYIKGSSHSKGG